jgi:NADPH-dependent 2,4-dienoyl-CoA reductase/sulfur reductase-like enzyme
MSAAARARRLDESAEIVVLERGEFVSFANCGLPYFVGGEITEESSLLVETPASLAAALNLDVRVRHDVVGLDADAKTVTVNVSGETRTISYDALVLSPGAAAIRPPIPGLDSAHVLTLRTVGDAVAMRQAVLDGATKAVVLGAGFIGIEAAEALALRGIATTLVELAPHVLPPLESEMARMASEELRRLGIDVREGVAASEVIPGEVADTVVLADGTRLIADIIVLSVGVRPDTKVFEAAGVTCERGAMCVDEHGRTNLPDVYAVGDAVISVDAVTGVRRPVALAGPANRAGRLVADAIFRPETARPIPAPLGTAVVRVGKLTVAMTGANRASLDAAGISYHTIHLHPNNHAGYFPGASTIDLLVHFRAGDGLLLGAQAVGHDGVEKRIDVLATAIRGGFVVADLIDLDLAYAPPYGSAKDPSTWLAWLARTCSMGR